MNRAEILAVVTSVFREILGDETIVLEEKTTAADVAELGFVDSCPVGCGRGAAASRPVWLAGNTALE